MTARLPIAAMKLAVLQMRGVLSGVVSIRAVRHNAEGLA